MQKEHTESEQKIKELALYDLAVEELLDPLAPSKGLTVRTGATSLPYYESGGRGFERLVLNLLIAQGKRARFFGDSGQRDYAVDIVVEHEDQYSLYQCKNYRQEPSPERIWQEIEKFKREWLHERGLPRPTKYVYCCPHSFSDLKTAESWLRKKEGFKTETGVEIHLLTLESLDQDLKRLPDIVADVFSEAYADFFCSERTWRSHPWTRITNEIDKQRHQVVRRFLDLHKKQNIYLDDELQDWFSGQIARENILLLRGLPGTGKTTTALELIISLTHPRRHVYYCSVKDGFDLQTMLLSVRLRSNIPSIFVLDDCHVDFKAVERLLGQLDPELNVPDGHVRFVLLARHTSVANKEDVIEVNNLVDELKGRDCCYTFKSSKENFRKVIEYLRPYDMKGLSKQRLDKLYAHTGGDLFLLDNILAEVATPVEIDSFNFAKLNTKIFDQYFRDRRTPPDSFRTLCCLAQFDLDVLRGFFGPVNNLDAEMIKELTALLSSPEKYRLLHSSLAELLFHAQCYRLYDPDGRAAITEEVIASVKDYCRWLCPNSSGSRYREDQLNLALKNIIHSDLRMITPAELERIKATILTDEFFREWISTHLDDYTFRTLMHCTYILAKGADAGLAGYIKLIAGKLTGLVSGDIQEIEAEDVTSMSYGLLALANYAPQAEHLLQNVEPAALLNILIAHGSLLELFFCASCAPATFASDLVGMLDKEKTGKLIKKTIASGRSIGTLPLAMWKLGQRDEGKEPEKQLLPKIEDLIGPEGLIRLILANGTLFELFMILADASPTFASDLVGVLDKEKTGELIKNTIASGRSIGTLHMAMWKLGQRDEGKEPEKQLLPKIEDLIGPEGLIRLILANGTLFELFMILADASPGFASDLVGVLDKEKTGELIKNTIASGRSIGTLNLAMWKLGQRDEGKEPEKQLLPKIEDLIGPEGLTRLILANGTLFELFRILADASPGFASDLVGMLDKEKTGKLIKKTIASGRSIGTLPLAMWKLGQRDDGKEQGKQLLPKIEDLIGPEGLIRLILANGTLFELFMILKHASPTFASDLVGVLDKEKTGKLIKKTIASGRSIGTLSLAMRKLGQRDEGKEQGKQLLPKIEDLIGPECLIRLILANGTLFELFMILKHASPTFASDLVGVLDKEKTGKLIKKTIASGRSIETLPYAPYWVKRILTVEQLWELVEGNGTCATLDNLHQRLDHRYWTKFIAAAAEITPEQWQRIICNGNLRSVYSFAAETIFDYPEQARLAFQQAVAAVISRAVEQSSWLDLHISIQSGHDDHTLLLIEARLRKRLATVSVSDLYGLDFVEAVNSISILWQERPDLQPELAEQFWKILPAPEKWPVKGHEIASIRFILDLARSPLISLKDAELLVNAVRGPFPEKTYKKIHTRPLFLLFWNLAALWYERFPKRPLKQLLPKDTTGHLLKLLVKRLKEKLFDEKIVELYGMAGLLGYLCPDILNQLCCYVRGELPYPGYLRPVALELTFVPAFFALLGMSLICPLRDNFTPENCQLLIKKAGEYEYPGRLIDKLTSDLKEMIGEMGEKDQQ